MWTWKDSSLQWQQHRRRCCLLSKAALLAGLILVTTLATKKMWSPQKVATRADHHQGGTGQVLVDYQNVDYRGFLFVVHDIHGLMLLRCTRKKNKGPHWQVPGGHIDEPEFLAAAKMFPDRSSQLQEACRTGAVRELYEETGVDLRSNLDRLIPASLRASSEVIKGKEVLLNEHKSRLFFFVSVNDRDFPLSGVLPTGSEGSHLRLKLSDEHTGFTFQPEPREAAEMLKLHSGGKVTEALLMAMERDESSSSPALRQRKNATDSPPERSSKNGHENEPQAAAASDDDDAPTRRRQKRDRVPVDVFPKPEKKSWFCCFR